jgi:GDP-4-dehydro-6-deoxy-D-mannose reductase
LLELSTVHVEIRVDPERLRPSDVPVSQCDNRRLVEATQWQPQIDLRTSLSDLLNFWRGQITKQ